MENIAEHYTEVNNGGDLVAGNIRAVAADVTFRQVISWLRRMPVLGGE